MNPKLQVIVLCCSSGSKSAFRGMFCSLCLWLLPPPLHYYICSTPSLSPSIFPFFSSPSTNIYFLLLHLLWHSWPEMREVIMKRKRRKRRAAQQRMKVQNSTSLAMEWQLMRRRTRTAASDACLHQRTSIGQRLYTDSCWVWSVELRMWETERC